MLIFRGVNIYLYIPLDKCGKTWFSSSIGVGDMWVFQEITLRTCSPMFCSNKMQQINWSPCFQPAMLPSLKTNKCHLKRNHFKGHESSEIINVQLFAFSFQGGTKLTPSCKTNKNLLFWVDDFPNSPRVCGQCLQAIRAHSLERWLEFGMAMMSSVCAGWSTNKQLQQSGDIFQQIWWMCWFV